MKKSLVYIGVIAALGVASSETQALTITWADNTSPLATYPTSNPGAYTVSPDAAFGQYNEFRVVTESPPGTIFTSGGGEKNLVGDAKITGAGKATTLPHNFVSWTFDNGSGDLTSVANTDTTPGAHYYAAGCGYITGTCTNQSAAPDGATGLFLNAAFLSAPFGFLAPTVGSAAATDYGPGNIAFDSTDNFTITFPVLEAQWNEGYFTLGSSAGGIVFDCSGANSGNITCTAENLITAAEDSLGFAGQTAQWELHGTLDTPHVSEVPVPAAVWLFGSGLLGLVGVARRKNQTS